MRVNSEFNLFDRIHMLNMHPPSRNERNESETTSWYRTIAIVYPVESPIADLIRLTNRRKRKFDKRRGKG